MIFYSFVCLFLKKGKGGKTQNSKWWYPPGAISRKKEAEKCSQAHIKYNYSLYNLHKFFVPKILNNREQQQQKTRFQRLFSSCVAAVIKDIKTPSQNLLSGR